MKTQILGILIAFALLSGAAAASEPVVIINEGVNVASMDPKALRHIFLGKTTSWDEAGRIIPVTLANGDVHRKFLKTYIRKTPSQFSTHWKRMNFTGKGDTIRTFMSETELIHFVAANPGAIGYVSSSAPVKGAKVVVVQ